MPKPSELIVRGPTFYSQEDEAAFFGWLRRIGCVEEVIGFGRNLLTRLAREPTDADLRDLCAILYRYRMTMSVLAPFGEGAKKAWFRDPQAWWHRRVYGRKG